MRPERRPSSLFSRSVASILSAALLFSSTVPVSAGGVIAGRPVPVQVPGLTIPIYGGWQSLSFASYGQGAAIDAAAALNSRLTSETLDVLKRFHEMRGESRGPWAYRLETKGYTPESFLNRLQAEPEQASADVRQAWQEASEDVTKAADRMIREGGAPETVGALVVLGAYMPQATKEAVVAIHSENQAVKVSDRIKKETALWAGKTESLGVQAKRSGQSGLTPGAPSDKGLSVGAVPAPRPLASGVMGREEEKGFFARIPTWGKVVGAITLVAGLVVGGFYMAAKRGNDFWEGSKSAKEVRIVEKARLDGNAKTLDALGIEARARHERMMKRIQLAEARGDKKVDLKDGKTLSLADAKAYAAFDLMIGLRAELAENLVSKDPADRIGEYPPADWHARLAQLEKAAKETGVEGSLARAVKEMQGEMARQNAIASRFERDIENFKEHSPTLFKGQMGRQVEAAKGDLSGFKSGEISPEQGAIGAFEGAMRGRVSVKHYGKSPEFKKHRDHRDRLAALHQDRIHPAAELSRGIAGDLDDVIRHRKSESYNLMMAATRTHVEVTKYRTATRQVQRTYTDSEGKTQTRSESESYQESYTDYEDQSGMYRMMAASDASAAQASAARANGKLEALRPMIGSLSRDPVLKEEGLAEALPSGNVSRVGEGSGAVWDWFMPPIFSLFSNMGSESNARQAAAEFNAVKGSMESVERAVASRRDKEAGWIDRVIDQDLETQMGQAKVELEKK